MPWLLYASSNSPQYPLNRMLDGPQNKCGCFGEEQNKLSRLLLYLLYMPRNVFGKHVYTHYIFGKIGYFQKGYYWHKILQQLTFSCEPHDMDRLVQSMHAYKSYTDEH
jgi:hypothetical protein